MQAFLKPNSTGHTKVWENFAWCAWRMPSALPYSFVLKDIGHVLLAPHRSSLGALSRHKLRTIRRGELGYPSKIHHQLSSTVKLRHTHNVNFLTNRRQESQVTSVKTSTSIASLYIYPSSSCR